MNNILITDNAPEKLKEALKAWPFLKKVYATENTVVGLDKTDCIHILCDGTTYVKNTDECWKNLKKAETDVFGGAVVALLKDGTCRLLWSEEKEEKQLKNVESSWKDIEDIRITTNMVYGLKKNGEVTAVGYRRERFDNIPFLSDNTKRLSKMERICMADSDLFIGYSDTEVIRFGFGFDFKKSNAEVLMDSLHAEGKSILSGGSVWGFCPPNEFYYLTEDHEVYFTACDEVKVKENVMKVLPHAYFAAGLTFDGEIFFLKKRNFPNEAEKYVSTWPKLKDFAVGGAADILKGYPL